MSFPLSKYKDIKDIYCVGYYGSNKKILKDLKLAKVILEERYPGLKLLISGEGFISREEVIEMARNKEFAYFRELKGENNNLVLEFLSECE